MKTLRKFFAVILVICMIVPSQIAWAIDAPSSMYSDEIQPHDTGYYVWRYVDHWDVDTVFLDRNGKEIEKERAEVFEYGESGPATERGEIYTANVQLGIEATIGAGIQLTLDELSYNLGYTFGVDISVGASRTTRSLNAGECVTVKYIPQYKKVAVLQEYGYKLHSDFYLEKTSINYVYIPVAPQIVFTYHY